MSMWSTRSEASMNDIDISKRRLRMGRRGDGLSRSLAHSVGDATIVAVSRCAAESRVATRDLRNGAQAPR